MGQSKFIRAEPQEEPFGNGSLIKNSTRNLIIIIHFSGFRYMPFTFKGMNALTGFNLLIEFFHCWGIHSPKSIILFSPRTTDLKYYTPLEMITEM